MALQSVVILTSMAAQRSALNSRNQVLHQVLVAFGQSAVRIGHVVAQ